MVALKIFKTLDFWLSFVFSLLAISFSVVIIPYVFNDALEGMFAMCLIFGFFTGEFLCEVRHLISKVIREEKERIHAIEQV
jgi:hypothetical protein